MDNFITQIAQRLLVKPFCTVFENTISRIFPRDTTADEERKDAIREFARQQGWSVKISDPGLRVTFRKPAEGERNGARSSTREVRPGMGR